MEDNKFIFLNVKTVPAFDPETLSPHTAYTVYICCDAVYKSASAWTLQDAIEMFASEHKCKRELLRLRCPFRPQ